MNSKTFTVTGEHFTGQPIDDVDVTHLGNDDKGNPVSEGLYRYPGGQQTIHRGDWIVTFPGGQRVIVSNATWSHAHKEEKHADTSDASAADYAQAKAVAEAQTTPKAKDYWKG